MVLVPFELRPDMPEEGWQISELEAAGHSDRVRDYLFGLAAREGFPLQIPPFLPNTHLALALGEMGRDAGPEQHHALHAAIFDAYFGKGLDIGTREVLLDVAGANGLSREDVEEVWDSGRYDDRLHQFLHVGLHLGIDSTPAALICNELLIGSRPYAVLADAIERCMVDASDAEEGHDHPGPGGDS